MRITVAGTADNVVGLVYIAAHVLDEGESVDDLQGRFPGVPLETNMHKAPFPIEGASEPGVEVSITPDAFPAIFAPDLPSEIAQVLAVSQRPARPYRIRRAGRCRRLEDEALLGTRGHYGSLDQPRSRAFRSQTSERHHHRGGGLARRPALPADGRRRPHPRRRPRDNLIRDHAGRELGRARSLDHRPQQIRLLRARMFSDPRSLA